MKAIASGPRLIKNVSGTGFTLIELLVTVLVIVVVSVVAMPSFTGFADRERLSSAAQDLYAQMLNARAESVARSAPIFMNFDADGSSAWGYGVSQNGACDVDVAVVTAANACVVVLDDGDGLVDPGDGSVDAADLMLRRYLANTHPGVSMSIVNFSSGGTSIRFDPIRGTSDAADIRLVSEEGRRLTVRLGLLGTPRICSPDGSVDSYSGVDCT